MGGGQTLIGMSDEARIVAEAGRLSGLALGGFMVLRRGARNVVIKARVDDSSSEVVIKAALTEEHLLARECAALQRVNLLPDARLYVPRLLAHDSERGIEVMEVVADAKSLDDYLNGVDGTAANTALVNTAYALSRLHAATARPTDCDDLDLTKEQSESFMRLEPAIREIYELAGVTWSQGVETDYARIAWQLENPGSAMAFTIGDMAPSNVLVRKEGIVFIDFEYAGCRHALYDAVFWRCICPMPAGIARQMDEAYQAGWAAAGRPWAAGTYAPAMTLLAGHRALWSLTWGMKALWDKDREMIPGVSGRRLMRNWLQGFYRFARQGNELLALAEATERLEQAMGARWPESEGDILFPVFAGDAKDERKN